MGSAILALTLVCGLSLRQVLNSEDGVALVEGLNEDAPQGTVVNFVNHAQG